MTGLQKGSIIFPVSHSWSNKRLKKQFIFIFILYLVFSQFLLTLDIIQSFSNMISVILASASSFFILLFDSNVMQNGVVLSHIDSGLAVQVNEACNALELTLLLYAAILAYPASTKNKLVGLGFGLLGIQLFNIIRIISLFYIIAIYPGWFDWAHEYLWRFIITLDVLLCFSAWIYYDHTQRRKTLLPA